MVDLSERVGVVNEEPAMDMQDHPKGEVAFTGLQRYYENARPGYPMAALVHLKSICPRPDPDLIVDVGCGTGKLTRQLIETYSSARVVGTDANADMIAQARSAFGDAAFQDYLVAKAEDLPFPDGSAGLLSAAQAVQWFDRPAFYAEAIRVLNAGGIIALVENNRDWRGSEFLDSYESLLEDNAPGYSRFYRDHDYAGELAAAGFCGILSESFVWTREVSPALFVQMAKSSTRMQAAIRATGADVLEKLQELLNRYATYLGIVEIRYETKVLTGMKRAVAVSTHRTD